MPTSSAIIRNGVGTARPGSFAGFGLRGFSFEPEPSPRLKSAFERSVASTCPTQTIGPTGWGTDRALPETLQACCRTLCYGRDAGAPIRGFGGVSQGSAPLIELMASVKATLDPLIGKPLSVTAIVDIMNKVCK